MEQKWNKNGGNMLSLKLQYMHGWWAESAGAQATLGRCSETTPFKVSNNINNIKQ